jgi:hypothetical protein
VPLDLFHLRRITVILDQPSIDFKPTPDCLGGRHRTQDSWPPYGRRFACLHDAVRLRHAGGSGWELRRYSPWDYPLYDLRFRVRDKDRELAVRNESWGEHNSTADYRIVNWPLAEGVYYRVFFFARNGSWLQDLQLRRSEKAACWLAATRVTGHPHATDFEYTDEEFNAAFGTPQWRD